MKKYLTTNLNLNDYNIIDSNFVLISVDFQRKILNDDCSATDFKAFYKNSGMTYLGDYRCKMGNMYFEYEIVNHKKFSYFKLKHS